MPTVTESLTKVQDQILETIANFQQPVVDLVKKVSETVEGRLPELPELSLIENLPSAQELVDNQFTFAEKLLKAQHEFATAVLEAAKPVTTKVVPEPKPAPKKSKTAAAA